ncbi:MAG TPA: CoA transferase [Dehalococcoidia bacterium]|nr:CoA transferase [Dehalococcoidia bacterium]
MSTDGQHPGPLAGVRILEFSEIIAAPFAGMLLSDMGAEVTKVEPPAGDPWRGFQPLGLREGRGYISLNRGKRGVMLDLNAPEAQEVVHRLVAEMDVVIINYRPDVAAKLRIDYPTLSALNPRLIYCDNTAFGRRGPYAHRPGYDIIAQAVTGLMAVEGRQDPGGAPLLNAIPSADLSTGLAMAWSVCAALYARERTGRGQCISTTLMGSAVGIQNTRIMSIEATDTEAREAALAKVRALRRDGASYKEQIEAMTGLRPAFGNIYYRCYRTADGFIAVGCLSTPLRKKLLAATGLHDWRVGKRPDEIDYRDQGVLDYCTGLVAEAEALFASKTSDEWLRILDAGGVPAGPVRFTEELLEDPQVLENNFITSVEHPLMGPVRMAGPMVQMTETPLQVQGPSPTLGQHTDEVLREAGLDDARIAELRARGVLGSEPSE